MKTVKEKMDFIKEQYGYRIEHVSRKYFGEDTYLYQENIKHTYIELEKVVNFIKFDEPMLLAVFLTNLTSKSALNLMGWKKKKKKEEKERVLLEQLFDKEEYEETVIQSLKKRGMWNKIETLPEENKKVFLPYLFLYGSIEKIAKELHMSKRMVKKKIEETYRRINEMD